VQYSLYCRDGIVGNEFGFYELLFVILLYLLGVFNTPSTVSDDIIPFGSKKGKFSKIL
jgi:hypothetical protein